MANDGRITWVLVDGENIDATFGTAILGRRPQPDERPRWDRLISFCARVWSQHAQGVFFLNASSGIPMAFVQALKAMDFVVVPLAGAPDEKVVDIGIQRTLDALLGHDDADLLLVSHDADFAPHIERLDTHDRRVGVIGFPEFTSGQFTALGVTVYDLESDVHAFNTMLPRVRIIPLDEFDPEAFLR